jgi:hypothetical protein
VCWTNARRRSALQRRRQSAENRDLWEYVLAMEACNIAMDEGRAPLTAELARLNAAQQVLKERYDRQRIVRRLADSASDPT